MAEVCFPYPHAADPDIFREALGYSEADTGFTATLIEKDYFCSLVLQYVFDGATSLVFKGGTCLNKVYVDFSRLSEDLDFVIPVAADTTRHQRRAAMKAIKSMVENLPTIVPGVDISEAFEGHNESRQYIGYLEYRSAVIDKLETIKVEIGLREPLLTRSESRTANTIAVNPFSRLPLIPPFTVRAMSLREAYAEKFRAAMTRREPAVRDFFDLFRSVREGVLDPNDSDFINMVKSKLEVPGNDAVEISKARKHELARQVEGQLRPVLRPADFMEFNFEEAFELACTMAAALSV
jgi:predicted nucleotidyltransferase component of viral defense system